MRYVKQINLPPELKEQIKTSAASGMCRAFHMLPAQSPYGHLCALRTDLPDVDLEALLDLSHQGNSSTHSALT